MRARALAACLIATAIACGGGLAAGTAAAPTPVPRTGPVPPAAPLAVLAWARAQSTALAPEGSQHLLEGTGAAHRLHALVGQARVLALGEPTHGAHEPLALRNRLFRQLVEQQGFTHIALETGLTESRILDDYVQGGPGDATEVARAGFTWGFGAYPENVALLQWMRDHNRAAAPEHRLRIYGFDLSGGDAGGFPHAGVALSQVLAYLERVAPAQARAQREAASPLVAWFDPATYAALPAADRQRMAQVLDGLAQWLLRERATLLRASSEDAHAWALRNAMTAQRLAQSLALLPADPATAGITPGMHEAMSLRDRTMADNLQWILDRAPGTARMLVFGHNAHVADAPLKGGIWHGLAQPPRMLGQHLRQRLGKDYVVMPVLASHSADGLPPSKPLPDGLEAAWAHVGTPAFLLDLRGAPAPVRTWLAQERPVRVNLVTETWLRPAQAFDAVIHVDVLHPVGWRGAAPGN